MKFKVFLTTIFIGISCLVSIAQDKPNVVFMLAKNGELRKLAIKKVRKMAR